MNQISLLDLFRADAASQVEALDTSLVVLERAPTSAAELEACMRAAHSFKGAARVVGIDVGVSVAHAMEDAFVAAQRGTLVLRRPQIDVLLRGVDLLRAIGETGEADLAAWDGVWRGEIDAFLAALAEAVAQPNDEPPTPDAATPVVVEPPLPAAAEADDRAERALRVTAQALNRLLCLVGESLVDSRKLAAFGKTLRTIKRAQDGIDEAFDELRAALSERFHASALEGQIDALRRRHVALRELLAEHATAFESFDHRSTDLAHRLYDQALACRMRPFSDGVGGFPRLARDVARELGKEIRLQVVGGATNVDRDILQQLEAPLGHLVRNAIDHGIESPDERVAAGKPPEGTVTLEAHHRGGMLHVIVSDDGRGIDLDRVRAAVVARKLAGEDFVRELSDDELLQFLFLPGFSMKSEVTEISGRGVGLDVVQTMVKRVHGTIRVERGSAGTRFQLQLPLSLSVVRALLVDVGGEPYAIPIAAIHRALTLPPEEIQALEGRQVFMLDGRTVSVVGARQVLHGADEPIAGERFSVVVLGEGEDMCGLIVERFLGEQELVVQPLDTRLGKIKDVAAGGLDEGGSPVLIVDAEDVIVSVRKLSAVRRLSTVHHDDAARRRKRVLVVDDSLTVRELERKLLDAVGYEVDVAVDGMDAWNAVRSGRFDLVVTDVDMPRMDGIELVELIKKDRNLAAVPVMIVSYKDREEDRRRGLDAGADYYLTKGSFQDDTLLNAVADLIGEAAA
ncbi:MAG: hybrid sensor histidine kinase/response regulator [Candidatus Eremiobacteraeota bacterium]|nr:hybrid sensor histidine kinase/response regulator [Candidatus Eremiobacteraeota bacterium]